MEGVLSPKQCWVVHSHKMSSKSSFLSPLFVQEGPAQTEIQLNK